MTGLGASLGGLIGMGRDPKLPPLPAGLGLPAKSGFVGRAKGEQYGGAGYDAQLAKANTYNKAFAELLNNQPQLTGAERTEIYGAYSDKFIPISYKKVAPDYKSPNKSSKVGDPEHLFYDYSSTLSQLNPEQYKAAQQQQFDQQQAAQAPEMQSFAPQAAPAPEQAAAPAPAPAPAAAPTVPAPAAAPVTVGPVATQPETTPTVATPSGNIAGSTATTNSDAKSKGGGRRGRMATLLTGLGGAVERFGL